MHGEEISFDAEKCVGCDTGLAVCAAGALDRKNSRFIDRNTCTLCFECTDECPSGALARVGEERSVEDLVELVRRDLPFFKNSAGGVTLSGGEPTLGMEFASDLLQRLKSLGVHTLIETCGYFDLEKFERLLYPFLDTVNFDLKIADPAEHKCYCGVDNRRIKSNFAALVRRSRLGGMDILPRIPLIPGITATEPT